MLSLDSGEDLGGVEAAGPFRLGSVMLFFFFLIFSFPSLSLDLLLALCGPVWYSPGVLPEALRCPHSTVYHSECSCLCWINVWFLSLIMLHFSSLLGLWALSIPCMKDTQQNRNTKNTNNFNLEQQQKESALRLNRNIL